MLGDGIYPNWALFIKHIKNKANLNDLIFMSNQEVAGKEFERLFCVVKCLLQILRFEIHYLGYHNPHNGI